MSPGVPYVELHAHSYYSLLDGVVSPRALVDRAAACGMPALALTDHDALYGAVPFILAAEAAGIKPLLGAEVTLAGLGSPGARHLTLLAAGRAGYANLCQLLTLARADQPKGQALLPYADLVEHAGGLIALSGCRGGILTPLVEAGDWETAFAVAYELSRLFDPESFYVELQRHVLPGETRLLRGLVGLAARMHLPIVATGNVHYLDPAQHELHDVLTCLRLHTTLDEAGARLRPNDEARFRTPQEMAALFADYPEALEATARIADRCMAAADLLPQGPQVLPEIDHPDGVGETLRLRQLCERALQGRYPPRDHRRAWTQLDHELRVIHDLGLARYFLIVHDVVRFATHHGIRCQGRGSAANSLAAYLLGIAPLDPLSSGLVFERFLSPQRTSPPDIDLDLAADRREEVIQYVLRRYGPDHAAMASTHVTFRARMAVRDTARVLGFPPPLVERLVGTLDHRDAQSVAESQALVKAFGEELATAPFQHLLQLAPQLDGVPRHLGIHNGGMVLSGPPLSLWVPLEPATMADRTVTQWDKEGLEATGTVKIDLLGLRMLAAVEDAVRIVEAATGARPDLAALAPDDAAVYAMLCRGESIGVFQLESRAQANLLPNFQPQTFADLVVQIALIRPGPLQANVVRPYLARRTGEARVRYPHPLLKPALAETLGLIVFQEQAIKVARDLAGFDPGLGERLRRVMGGKGGPEGRVEFAHLRERFVAGAGAKGVPSPVAEGIFALLQRYAGYTFPKSHAAAFAALTYQTAWLRCYHPAAFFAGLLRHQPMGFYPPDVIVAEARRHGVAIYGVDVGASDVDATVEGEGMRLGLRMVRGLGAEGVQQVVRARRNRPFASLEDFCRRTGLGRRDVDRLIQAGAFDAWDIPRRQLLWDLHHVLELTGGPPKMDLPEPDTRLAFAPLAPDDRLRQARAVTGVAAERHLVTLAADRFRAMGVVPSSEVDHYREGATLRVGGVVIARQRPPTAGGTAFVTLEDEAGVVNVVVRPRVYDAYREALRGTFVVVEGTLSRRGRAVSVVAKKVWRVEVDSV